MRGLFALIIPILDVIAILDCVKTIKDGGKKILWIVLIIVMPFLGLILYYLLGKKQA